MSEKPILYSAPMIRAILARTKTQTRRIVTNKHALSLLDDAGFTPAFVALPENGLSPYGYPLDDLWVRETWAPMSKQIKLTRVAYRADGIVQNQVKHQPLCPWLLNDSGRSGETVKKWKPSIHMPRWASRITLEITAVRVERLQEMSIDDARAEGIPQTAGEAHLLGLHDVAEEYGHEWDNRTSVENFARLWDTINGKRAPWSSNPWVWCLTFERVTP